MNVEEAREIIDNMSEQELNDFIFFALQEVEKENQKLKTKLEKKEAIINEMAKQLVEAHGWFYSEFDNFTEKNWIDYFRKKVTEINVGDMPEQN